MDSFNFGAPCPLCGKYITLKDCEACNFDDTDTGEIYKHTECGGVFSLADLLGGVDHDPQTSA